MSPVLSVDTIFHVAELKENDLMEIVHNKVITFTQEGRSFRFLKILYLLNSIYNAVHSNNHPI